MTFVQFKDACFKLSLEKGCDSAEVYCTESNAFSVNVREGELDKYTVARGVGLNLRVNYAGKCGYAYTEIFENPEFLVERAIDNAMVIESKDENPMQPSCEYQPIVHKPNPVVEMSEKEKIEIATNMEKDALAFDGRVNRIAYSTVETGTEKTHIYNTLGLHADSDSKFSYSIIGPILRQGDEERNSFAFKMGADIVKYDEIIKESVDNALMQFNAGSVDSGEYAILMRYDAAGDLLFAFSSMFSADNVQKGLSLLAGKLGEVVASDKITIIDDPFEADNPRAFDEEGVPSVVTTVIENGVLKSFLYNLKTALKDNVASTSNAGRMGASAPIDIAPSNLYIVKGEKSYDDLIKKLGNGIIITDISGLHAGLNTVSGDFSLLARGLLVENGNIVRSVDQITCAGNFLGLMKGIIEVGSDLKFGLPGNGRVGSPSLLIDKLVISGK